MTYSESGLNSELVSMKGGNFALYLESELKSLDRQARSCVDDVRSRWLQGQGQLVERLLEMIDVAEYDRRPVTAKSRQQMF